MNLTPRELTQKAKSNLQELIDTGRITARKELLAYVKEKGWKLTRSGKNYIGVMDTTGRRFRVRFSFEDEWLEDSHNSVKVSHQRNVDTIAQLTASSKRVQGYWFYALWGQCAASGAKCVYIGQTTNITRRLQEHQRGHEVGKSSFRLFEWAGRLGVQIKVLILAHIETNQAAAMRIEGHFLQLAMISGYEAPGVESWGQFPALTDSKGLPSRWPTDEEIRYCKPLTEVMDSFLHYSRTKVVEISPMFPSDVEISPVGHSGQIEILK